MQTCRISLLFTLIGLFFLPLCSAVEVSPLPEFSKDDKVLILAPHPDDEAIGTGGVIQRALKVGAKVKVCCFTNGDHNEVAFIVYEKRFTIRQREFIHMGEVRRKETIKALTFLGLNREDIIFLGYPDFGTMEILTKYWGNDKPFRGLLTRISHVPYAECLSPGAPYAGKSILRDLEDILLYYKPNKIFVSHPTDKNRDHRSLYLFLNIALWDLDKKIDRPEVYPYIIHVIGWPKPHGYHPELGLFPPDKLINNEISWRKLDLTDEEIKVKNEIINFYQSQIKADPPYLFTFARKNELFGDYSVIDLEDTPTGEEINWYDVSPPPPKDKEGEISPDLEKDQGEEYISRLFYASKDKELYIKVIPKIKIGKALGISVFLLGYNKKTDFALMPKILLIADSGGLRIKDKKTTLFIKNVGLIYEGNIAIIRIPLSVLGNPEYILSCVRPRVASGLPLDDTAWRILRL
ncbi:MAG: PIG-L family deacetylase [Candidatus Omnitrophica bacterium]|nr:PIG-L family deacetylase [Candidatus Omnitrophota bacterium]